MHQRPLAQKAGAFSFITDAIAWLSGELPDRLFSFLPLLSDWRHRPSADVKSGEQLHSNGKSAMRKIYRGSGLTPSEKYLAKLADKTFLNLWSYPNLFIDKRTAKNGSGKELCDLLIVCGDDILIFSDKNVSWPPGDPKTAWSRWYRRAIEKSVAQVRGADRWLRDFPERIFLDANCSQSLPISLPLPERRRIHGIVVAIGANRACAQFFGGTRGTLPIVPRLKGAHHYLSPSEKSFPFGIGDVNPGGSFIHVFDDEALDLVMRELDTVADFTQYLIRREKVIRSGHLLAANGEEEMLGLYLQRTDNRGQHDFVKPDSTPWGQDDVFAITDGMYSKLIDRPEYIQKKRADQISYQWDKLINAFTNNLLAGTSVAVSNKAIDLSGAEKALRDMALENRTYRRMLGEALTGAIEGPARTKQDMFCRMVMPGYESKGREFAYVFLVMPYPQHMNLRSGYDQYRKVRMNMLHAYCLNVLADNRNLKRVLGIALDGPPKSRGAETSEDLLSMDAPTWTPKLEREAREIRHKFNVLQPGRLKLSRVEASEYPNVEKPLAISRQQRRAHERAIGKTERRRKQIDVP